MQFSLLFLLKQGAKYIWNSFFFLLFCFLCLLILTLFSLWKKKPKLCLIRQTFTKKKYDRYEFYKIGNYPNQDIYLYTLSIFSARRKHQGAKSFKHSCLFRVHQFESILTIVNTFKRLKPAVHQFFWFRSYEIWTTIIKIYFRAKLWQRVRLYYP